MFTPTSSALHFCMHKNILPQLWDSDIWPIYQKQSLSKVWLWTKHPLSSGKSGKVGLELASYNSPVLCYYYLISSALELKKINSSAFCTVLHLCSNPLAFQFCQYHCNRSGHSRTWVLGPVYHIFSLQLWILWPCSFPAHQKICSPIPISLSLQP
jgi:hypothetical protein